MIHEFLFCKLDLRAASLMVRQPTAVTAAARTSWGWARLQQRRRWQQDWSARPTRVFRQQLALHERFGAAAPWLDAAAQAPAGMGACACGAYWVARERFALEFPQLASARRLQPDSHRERATIPSLAQPAPSAPPANRRAVAAS